MIKLKNKIIISALAVTLLSSSAVSAAGYNYSNANYNTNYNNYSNSNVYKVTYDYSNYENPTYDYNWNGNKSPSIQETPIVAGYPVFTWNVVNNTSWNRPNKWTPTPEVKPEPKPEAQIPVKPEKPQEDIVKPAPEQNTVKPIETPEVQAPSISGMSQIETEVVRLVNIERQKEGLSPLTTSSEFSNVARKKSEDMAVKGYFSHTSPTYGSPFDMMKTFGIKYNTAGENIAKGQISAESVMRAWMNSSGHRANIMNPSFNKIGVGMYEKNGTKYWTQMFTN